MTQPYGSSPEPGPPAPGVPSQPQYQQAPPPAGYAAPAPAPYQGIPAQPYAAAPYAGAPGPVVPLQYKDSTAAWLLWFFTGYVGGHHFYLGRTQRGVAYAITFAVSLVLSFVIIGFLGYVVLFVLWIIDATRLTQELNDYNARAYATNQSLGRA
jgi:TM2 domain-containing membrane protein YozV